MPASGRLVISAIAHFLCVASCIDRATANSRRIETLPCVTCRNMGFTQIYSPRPAVTEEEATQIQALKQEVMQQQPLTALISTRVVLHTLALPSYSRAFDGRLPAFLPNIRLRIAATSHSEQVHTEWASTESALTALISRLQIEQLQRDIELLTNRCISQDKFIEEGQAYEQVG